MKIALIDDDQSYCRMLRLWLSTTHRDDTLYEFHTREEVERHLDDLSDLDVAIVDRNVSGMDDGPAIAEEVKAVCNCLIVSLSAGEGSRYGDRYLRKGDYKKVVEIVEEIRREKNAA